MEPVELALLGQPVIVMTLLVVDSAGRLSPDRDLSFAVANPPLVSTNARRGEQTRYARHFAREIATFRGFRESRNSSPRGTSSPLELAIE
jgi:hypothetical protein